MVAGDVMVPSEEPEEESEQTSRALAPATQSLAAAYAASLPKDWGLKFEGIIPALDIAKLVPPIDTSIISSIVDADWFQSHNEASARALSSMISAADFMPKVDFSDFFATSATASIFSSLDGIGSLKDYGLPESFVMPDLKGFDLYTAGFAEQMKDWSQVFEPFPKQFQGVDWEELLRRQSVPHNWSRATEDRLEVLIEMVSGEGIPAAWVPRAEILEALLDASPGDERSELLIARRDEILEDCACWIDDLEDDFLAPVLPVARQVLDVCRNGHWQVAAIAAVTVVHNVVEALHWVSDRQRVAKYHRLTMDTPQSKLLEQATRAPLVPFYDNWSPESGQPRPTHVTRHVVSHHLDADQVTERNCIVAVMLMSSLLVTVYQLELGAGEQAA